jgi:transposase
MEAYSLDLRERVVRAVDGGMSRVEAARRFSVSNALIGKLLRQRRGTGSLAPKPHAGGTPPTLGGPALAALRAQVQADPDATLAELRERLARDAGVRAGVDAVCRALRRLGLPLKKRRCTPGSGTRHA